ncbi:MAG: hypothetical protein Cons2KO_32670 [Congregibacter sp.]
MPLRPDVEKEYNAPERNMKDERLGLQSIEHDRFLPAESGNQCSVFRVRHKPRKATPRENID